MTKTLKYPNGEPVSLKETWDFIDQYCMNLAESAKLKAEAKAKGFAEAGLTADEEKEAITERNRLLQFLVTNHGDKLKPQAKYTVVTKEKNDRNRHFRKGEFRLFIGEWSAVVIEVGVTADNLDIDPKKLKRVLTVYDDAPFREAKTADERKEKLKEFVKSQ